MIKKYSVILMIFCSLFLISSKKDTSVFNVGFISDPQTLNPHFATNNSGFNIAVQLFEGLTVYDPENSTPKPGVAESWTISDDGLVYTFKLRKNAKWSDGKPVTAYSFKYSFLHALTPGSEVPYKYLLFYIKNAEKYHNKKVNKDEVGLKIISNHKFQIILENPISFFLDLTMMPVFMPIPEQVVSDYGKKWAETKNIVSNGPFILTDFESQKKVVFSKNMNYWDKNNVKLNKIIINVFEEDGTALEEYKKGKLEWLVGLNAIETDGILDHFKDQKIDRLSLFLTYFYRLNTKHPVLKDVRIRKALYLALNRNYLCRKLFNGGDIPAYSFVPRNMPGYVNYPGEREDPEKARKLLAEAGYPDGENFPDLTLTISNYLEHKIIAEAVKKMIKDELKININIEVLKYSEYRKKMFALDYEITQSTWIGDYLDPNTFLEIFDSSTNGNNRTGWSNNNYTQLLKKAKRERNKDVRYKYYYNAEKILVEEVPIIPVKNSIALIIRQPYVKGIFPNVMQIHPLKEVYLKD